jgi:hypothetical protein
LNKRTTLQNGNPQKCVGRDAEMLDNLASLSDIGSTRFEQLKGRGSLDGFCEYMQSRIYLGI